MEDSYLVENELYIYDEDYIDLFEECDDEYFYEFWEEDPQIYESKLIEEELY